MRSLREEVPRVRREISLEHMLEPIVSSRWRIMAKYGGVEMGLSRVI